MVAIKLLILCSAVAVALGIDNGKSCLLSTSKCVTNAECKSADDSKWNCLYGACACKAGYSRTSDTKCDAMIKHDQDCSNGKVCDDRDHLECKNNKCACKDKYERKDNSCKLKESEKKALNESCTKDFQCVKGVPTGSTVCQGATTCKCAPLWTTDGKNCENQEYDKSCSKGTNAEKCRRGGENLECKDNKCVCKSNYNYNSRYKMCLHKDSKLDRSEGDTCSAAIKADEKKYDICKNNLECRKCHSDSIDTGLCVDVTKMNPEKCNGSSQISVSVALLLTTVLAYLAY